jgi:hypothetical protein
VLPRVSWAWIKSGVGDWRCGAFETQSCQCYTIDQHGMSRPQNGARDVGAYEYTAPLVTVTELSSVVTFTDDTRLRAWLLARSGTGTSLDACRGCGAEAERRPLTA